MESKIELRDGLMETVDSFKQSEKPRGLEDVVSKYSI